MINFDFAATTPMSEKAISAYAQAAEFAYGNSSSLHDIGEKADEVLSLCRKTFASLIGGSEKGFILQAEARREIF